MTLFNAAVPASALHAPVLPEDKARASELWGAVVGTDLEGTYRDVSARHPDKNQGRAAYLAFLADIEALFVVPEARATFRDFNPTSQTRLHAEEDDLLAEDDAESRMEDEAQEEGTGDLDTGEEGEAEADTTDAEATAPSAEVTPVAPVTAAPAPLLTAPTSSGFLAQLAGMLAGDGQLTLQMLRVGEQLTLGIFPQPHPGEAATQPLIITESADWLDANLIPAMQGFTQARRDAFAVCQEAANKQQAANKKAAEARPTPAPAAKAAGKGPKTFAVTLEAAEGTTLTGKQGSKDVALVIGENQIAQGNLEVTASHPLFGEQKKTLTVYGAKTHDFREQQGGRVRVEVDPESAALSATKGETTLALHGETLLPTGKWTITAEAADFQTATQSVTVKAGNAEVIQMALKPVAVNSLF